MSYYTTDWSEQLCLAPFNEAAEFKNECAGCQEAEGEHWHAGYEDFICDDCFEEVEEKNELALVEQEE